MYLLSKIVVEMGWDSTW